MALPAGPTGTPKAPPDAAAELAEAVGVRLKLPHTNGEYRPHLPRQVKEDAPEVSALALASIAFSLLDISASLRRLAPQDPAQ